jgi:hypothetical protein
MSAPKMAVKSSKVAAAVGTAQSDGDDRIALQRTRFERLRSAIYDIANANKALLSNIPLFPEQNLADDGEVDVDIAINAFSSIVQKNTSVLIRIINDEDMEESAAPPAADTLNQWIKVTPETMPEHGQPVLAWSEKLGRSEPAFYDHELEFWCRLFDNGSTVLEGKVPCYRFDSQPLMCEKGGAQ